MFFYHVKNKAQNGKMFNFGDMLPIYIHKKVSNQDLCYLAPSDSENQETNFLCGSIVELSKQNCVIYGCGLCNAATKPVEFRKILSLRGKLTHQSLAAVGVRAPQIFGDIGLLLPKIYQSQAKKKYRYGIIPHVNQFAEIAALVASGENTIKLIDLTCTDIEKNIDNILQCERILSSSLHGVIVAHAYNVPVLPIKFGNLLSEFKFQDHFSALHFDISLQKVASQPVRVDITNTNRLDQETLNLLFLNNDHLLLQKPIHEIVDLDFLWKICPLNPVRSVHIAFVSDKYVHVNTLERDFYEQYLGCKKIENANSQYIGFGLDVVDPHARSISYSLPIEDQIAEIYGTEDFFDIICTLPGGGVHDLSYFTKGSSCMTLIHFHETFNGLANQVLQKLEDSWHHACSVNAVVFKCAKEAEIYKDSKFLADKVVKCVPQLAPLMFIAPVDTKRDIDIGIVGNLTASIYPERARLFNILKKSVLGSQVVRYCPNPRIEQRTKAEIDAGQGLGCSDLQQKNYCDFLHRCKIVLCTRSKYDYVLKKYSEAALSRCLIVGNIPSEIESLFGEFIVNLDGLNENDVVKIVRDWLANDIQRENVTNACFQRAKTHLTMNNQLETYIDAHSMYKNKTQ